MDLSKLSRAGIRPARTTEDLARAAEFAKTPRLRDIAEANPDERGCVRLCEADDELLGVLVFDPAPLRVRETSIRCARVLETAGEDGRLHFRRTGDRDLFDFMLEELLGYLWARRYPIAFVHGELALYPQHGFVPCYYHPRVYVPVATALALPRPYRIRHLKSDDARAIVEFRGHNQRYRPTVYASGVPMFHHFSVEGPDRQLKGYFSLELDKEKKRFLAPEVEAIDHHAACTILHHCAERAHAHGLKELQFPLGLGHPIANFCLEIGGHSVVRGATADPLHDEEMLHLADPARLATALAPYFERRLARAGAQETRAEIPIATERGAWACRVAAGQAAFVALERPPEHCIRLPHWALTQIFAGYRSVRDVGVEMRDEDREFLRLLFPKTWPYSMPDPELWDGGAARIPYKAAAAKVARRTRLPWND